MSIRSRFSWIFSGCIALATLLMPSSQQSAQAQASQTQATQAQTPAPSATKTPLADQYLISGQLAQGEEALLAHLQAHPKDDEARFSLGMIQTLRALEYVSQSFYRHGLLSPQTQTGRVGLFRLPMDFVNPSPDELSYDQLRGILVEFLARLNKAEQTLAGIKSTGLKVPVPLGKTRLDLNGDGNYDDQEMLGALLMGLTQGDPPHWMEGDMRKEFLAEREKQFKQMLEFSIAFDDGDRHWLQGYCNLLAGTVEFALAHDASQLFNSTAQLFVPRPVGVSPYFLPSQADEESNNPLGVSFGTIADAIALIHLINFEVTEPERLKASHAHFLAMVEHSRDSWKAILAETDDDREWIPNPNQTSVMMGLQVDRGMITQWHTFLDEWEGLLTGKKLAPFWRNSPKNVGVNIAKVFEEPRPLDLVLWIQGTAALPYLEEGEVTSQETWEEFQRAFGGNFIGFAFWFN